MHTRQGHKYLWKLPSTDMQQILSIASSYNLSFPIAQTLLTRGFATKEAIDSYLFSTFEKDVAHPSQLKDADKAVDRIMYALQHNEKILIAGDYDVDGVTSSALMMVCLLPLGAQINFFLPHRVKDGYGLSTKIIDRAADNGYKLVVTVDNGITAFEPALRARERGIDLIITDHHKPHAHMPEAYAIVNPHQQDCSYPFKVFAGVGVSFKLMSLLYEKLGRTMPAKAYELLLLGTIADVVPLLGENRYWVRHGLQYINAIESPSFKVLKHNGNISKPVLSSTDIGFSIAPQINALGRLEDARQGVRFLIGSDEQEVEQVGKILFELNQARKDIERSIVQSVEQKIVRSGMDLSKEHIIIASDNAWPPGVIGLVASRMVSTYGKPTLLFHLTKDGLAKGSCRSIPEFNMFHALQSCSDLLKQFGGHAQAAGLSLPAEHIPALKERLETLIAAQLTEFDLKQKLVVDAELSLPDATKKMLADMQHLEPFGNENKQPLFYIKDVMLVQKPTLLKDAHVKCSVFSEGVIKPVMFFNRPELFPILNQLGETSCDMVCQVMENHWNGRVNIELQGIDVAKN
ncbi:MAG: single-stranded-DNA-specific exonuclease RecJ [Candidatus Babeliales bacterium]